VWRVIALACDLGFFQSFLLGSTWVLCIFIFVMVAGRR
jgi:hypothetical protein